MKKRSWFLSGHPLTHYKTEIEEFVKHTTKDLKCCRGQEVKIIGIISDQTDHNAQK